MKNKYILKLTSLIALSVSFVPNVYSQSQNTNENSNMIYDSAVEYIQNIINKQKEYIDLREKGFDEISNLDSSLKYGINQDLSDISTKLSRAENTLRDVNESNYEEILGQLMMDLGEINTDLIGINDDHRARIKENINFETLVGYKNLNEDLYQVLDSNKDKLPEGSFEEISSKIEETNEIIKRLETEYSESDWVRLDGNMEDIHKMLGETADTISLQNGND